MRWTDMKLRTVLAIAAFVACVRPAEASLSNAPLVAADVQITQTPAQVFVRASRGPNQGDDGDGAHGGLRPPRSDDDGTLPLYDTAGTALYFTLEKWRAAGGTIDLTPEGEGDRVSLTLHRLIAFGHYSVFVRTDASGGPQFVPLDASGITNNFDAHQDGSASVTVSAPQHLGSGAWVVTIYHSDAQDHGNSPGEMMRTAHQQLLVKLP